MHFARIVVCYVPGFQMSQALIRIWKTFHDPEGSMLGVVVENTKSVSRPFSSAVDSGDVEAGVVHHLYKPTRLSTFLITNGHMPVRWYDSGSVFMPCGELEDIVLEARCCGGEEVQSLLLPWRALLIVNSESDPEFDTLYRKKWILPLLTVVTLIPCRTLHTEEIM